MLRVIAAQGLRVPHEKTPREYITATPIDVPDTTYYRRRLAAGELVPAPPVETDATATAADAATVDAAAAASADATAAAASTPANPAKNRSKS